MINVSGKRQSGIELFRIELEQVRINYDGTADYSVKFVVDRSGAVGMHSRVMYGFPKNHYNALGLLKLALDTLDPTELELENGSPDPSDMARRQHGVGN